MSIGRGDKVAAAPHESAMIVIRQRADFRHRPDRRGGRLRATRICRGDADDNGGNCTRRPEAEWHKPTWVNHRSLAHQSWIFEMNQIDTLSDVRVNVGFSELQSATAKRGLYCLDQSRSRRAAREKGLYHRAFIR